MAERLQWRRMIWTMGDTKAESDECVFWKMPINPPEHADPFFWESGGGNTLGFESKWKNKTFAHELDSEGSVWTM